MANVEAQRELPELCRDGITRLVDGLRATLGRVSVVNEELLPGSVHGTPPELADHLLADLGFAAMGTVEPR